MRKVWSKWLAVAVVAISILAMSPANAQRSVSLQVFYDELQSYGNWIDHGRYGYVWMPDAGPDFVPYGSNGYWVQTGYGNTWVSNYSWGWAPFHYGRWFHDDFYGWLWVPDTNWGPAWVTWRSGGGYYGWAPLMPGLSVSMNVGYYNSIPHHYWNFVPYRYVMYRQVYRHCVPRPRVVNVIHQTTVIVNNNNHYYDNDGVVRSRDRRGSNDVEYFTGPSRSEIERRNGERVTVYDVHDREVPGRTEVSRNSISLFKPAVEQPTRSRAFPAAVIRDNEEGRENISRIRTRQQRDQGSSDEFDGNRSAIRDGRPSPIDSRSTIDNRSTIDRSSREGSVPSGTFRDIQDLRREPGISEMQQRRSNEDNTERNDSRREALDRLNRDVDFNTRQRQREYNEQRRQQLDVLQRDQLQRDGQTERMREMREEGVRERQQRFEGQRQMQERRQEPLNRSTPREFTEPTRRQQPEQYQRSPRQFQELQPRERSETQRSPAREPSQFQRSSPSRQPEQRQYSAPPQRPSGEQRMSTPGRTSGSELQRPSTSRSGQQRSRD